MRLLDLSWEDYQLAADEFLYMVAGCALGTDLCHWMFENGQHDLRPLNIDIQIHKRRMWTSNKYKWRPHMLCSILLSWLVMNKICLNQTYKMLTVVAHILFQMLRFKLWRWSTLEVSITWKDDTQWPENLSSMFWFILLFCHILSQLCDYVQE